MLNLLITLMLTLGNISAQQEVSTSGEEILADNARGLFTGVMVKVEDGTTIIEFASISVGHNEIIEKIEKEHGTITEGLWAGEIETYTDNFEQARITSINEYAGVVTRRSSLFKNASAENLYNKLLELDETKYLVAQKPDIDKYSETSHSLKPSSAVMSKFRHEFASTMDGLSQYMKYIDEGDLARAKSLMAKLKLGGLLSLINMYYVKSDVILSCTGISSLKIQVMMGLITEAVTGMEEDFPISKWQIIQKLYKEGIDATYKVSIKPEDNSTLVAKILEKGLSKDYMTRLNEVDLLINYFYKNPDDKIKQSIFSILDNLSTNEINEAQQDKIETIRDEMTKTAPHSLKVIALNFNENSFKSILKRYIPYNGKKEYSTDELVEFAVEKLVGSINISYQENFAISRIIEVEDLSLLSGPNGLLSYLTNRMSKMRNGKTKSANILGIYALIELTRVVPESKWPTSHDIEWFKNFSLDMDSLITERMKDPKFKEMFDACKMKDSFDFDVQKGLKVFEGK